MSVGVGLEGLPELVTRTDRAHAGLLDLTDVNTDLARLVTDDTREPIATGAMRASRTVTVTGTGWGITYGQPYAVAVQWGTRYMRARPFIELDPDAQLAALTQHVQQLLD